MTTFTARKKTRKLISAGTYLKWRAKNPKTVEGARVLPPKLGRNGFGMFVVERDIPIYEVLPSRKA